MRDCGPDFHPEEVEKQARAMDVNEWLDQEAAGSIRAAIKLLTIPRHFFLQVIASPGAFSLLLCVDQETMAEKTLNTKAKVIPASLSHAPLNSLDLQFPNHSNLRSYS